LGFIFNGNCSIIKSEAYTCIFNLLGICVQGEKVEVNGDDNKNGAAKRPMLKRLGSLMFEWSANSFKKMKR